MVPMSVSGARTADPTPEMLSEHLVAGDRAALARAITLIESRKPAHQERARALMQVLLPHTGRAIRVGITGVPGVGKSTLIDTLGTNLTGEGRRIAVLAIDPSSSRTGGSILGDKTRMARLATDPHAFIRPSPAAGTLGGVAARTRETMLLCEAAGFDVVLVETVGIGQSETAVADMTDFFLVLMLSRAGDELQGIKKGVLELADMIRSTRRRARGAAPPKPLRANILRRYIFYSTPRRHGRRRWCLSLDRPTKASTRCGAKSRSIATACRRAASSSRSAVRSR